MNTTLSRRAGRLLVAGALLFSLVNCGGSDSGSTSNRNRNSALEDCTTTTTAAATTTTTKKSDKKKSDSEDSKKSDENENENISSQDCSPDNSYEDAAQEPRECEVNWNTDTKTITFCDSFNRFEVVQKNKDGNTVTDGESAVDSEEGTNAVTVTLKDKVRKIKVTVYQKDPDGQLVKSADVEFRTSVASKTSFEYTPQPVPTTSTTEAMPDTTLAADTTVPVDTTMPAADTTVPVDTTMPAADTTMPASESTVAANSPDTTLAPDTTIPQNGDLQPVVMQKTDCQASYDATSSRLTMCRAFDFIYVAMYDMEGTYAGKVESKGKGNYVDIEKSLVEQGIRAFRIEVGNKMADKKTPQFLGDGWLILDLEDAEHTANVLVDMSGTWVADSGWETSFNLNFENGTIDTYTWWMDTGAGRFLEVNGVIVSTNFSTYKVPGYQEGTPVTWKAFEADGMGLPRLVANGVITEPTYFGQVDFYSNALDIDKEVIQFFEGIMGSSEDDPELADTVDACKDVQPFMVTDPATPSRRNMVTITVDADCKDQNHMIGAVIFGDSWMPVWAQFLQTKYTQRIQETVYLPDGEYEIVWGSQRMAGWHDFMVNGGDNGADCTESHLRVDAQAKTAQLTNCTIGNANLDFTAYQWNGPGEVSLPINGTTLQLKDVDFSGWFAITSGWRIPMPDFLVCLKDCELSDEPINVDQSAFADTGRVSTDYECSQKSTDTVWWNSGVDFYGQYRDGYAYEWRTWHPEERSAGLNDGGKFLLAGYCSWMTQDPQTGDYHWDNNFRMSLAEISGTPNGAPVNDNVANAVDIPNGTGRVNFSNVRGTSASTDGAPWWAMSGRESNYSSVWFKFTAEEAKTMRLTFENSTMDMEIKVFKQTPDGLRLLTDGWWARYFEDSDAPDFMGAWFNTKASSTYFIQIMGDWIGNVGQSTLVIGAGDGSTLDSGWGFGDSGSDTTVPQASDTTVAQGSDTTVAQGSDTTVAQAPDTTAPSQAPDTTVARGSDTTAPSKAPDTTVARGSDTTAPQSTDNAPTTTVVQTKDQRAAEAYNDAFKAGDKEEKANVEMPVGGGDPVVEVRETVTTVEIPVVDIFATLGTPGGVSKADATTSMTIFVKGSRPIRVTPGQKSVRIPVLEKTTDIAVTGTGSDGKQLSSLIVVKKTKPSLLDQPSSSSNTPLYAGIGAVIVVLLALFFFMKSRKEEDEATQA